MALNTYLVITDGTVAGTVTIAAYGLISKFMLARDGWAPVVPALSDNQLAAGGEYDAATEEIEINIAGASAADAYAAMDLLSRLMDQAKRHTAGKRFTGPVLMKYSPKGGVVSSETNPLQARILDGYVQPSTRFSQAGNYYIIQGVRLRFRRTALWLGAAETASSAATPNGDLASITMPSALNANSPCRVTVTNFGLSNGVNYQHGYVALAENADEIQITNAEAFASGAFTSVADSAFKLPRNTNVLRYTPTVTTEVASALLSVTGLSTSARQLAVLANIRNNSASASFLVRVEFFSGWRLVSTRPKPISPYSGAAYPLWYPLGIVAGASQITGYRLALTASAVGAGTLDIDTLVLVNISNPANAILKIIQAEDLPVGYSDFAPFAVTIDHATLTGRTPVVTADVLGPPGWPVGYRGQALIANRAQSLRALVMQTGGESTRDFWRAEQSGEVLNNVVTIERTKAYLTPQ